MTLVARKVLADCETAHQLLKKEEMESATWRVHWVGCLALLRAVGHILHHVDGEADTKYRDVITAKWDDWRADKPANAIFWDFIEVERNNLLKEYKFGVEAEPAYLELEEGGRLLTEEGAPLRLEEDFFRLSHVGFENRDGRDVIDEAIKWWRTQLDEIEA
jgi:hypothetical protein